MTHAMPLWTISGPRPGSLKWFGMFALALLISISLVLMGCSFASFIAAAEADLPVIIQIVLNLTNVIAPSISAQVQTEGNLALTALALLCGSPAIAATKCDPASLIGQYQATPTATILQKIQASFATLNAHLSNILSIANGIPQAIANGIVVGVGLALSTITSIMALIPAAQGQVSLSRAVKAAAKIPQAKELKAGWNAAVGGSYAAAVVH